MPALAMVMVGRLAKQTSQKRESMSSVDGSRVVALVGCSLRPASFFQPMPVAMARSCSLHARDVNNERVKFRVHWSVDYWPISQFFRWIIPWSPLGNSALNGMRNQSTDLVAL
jgi:hypothetical protein